ncbi:MAG: hypothetical protein KDD61_06750 [Bdellovibrionales bacterium]|nr:hypothetical protein [Bdellovibrionales bacterium]
MTKVYSLSAEYEALIEPLLKAQGYSLKKPKPLADAIVALSDRYHQKHQLENLWQEPSHRAAYLAYFMPLNSLRAQSLIEEGQRHSFWEGLSQWLDFGSGLGAMDWAFQNSSVLPFHETYFVEKGLQAQDLHQKLLPRRKENRCWLTQPTKLKSIDSTLITFSYSLNELGHLPDWALQAEALCIVEPSTKEDGRKLLSIRQQLIDSGFSIWAPCVHQMACPLLTQSHRDWCHHRVAIELPESLQQIEKHLPMKNRTLTYSYLLARKTSAPAFSSNTIRVIGDTLKEKGKTRQLICRGDQREFFAWLHKLGDPQFLPHGSLVELLDPIELKGQEIRLHSPVKVL